MATLAAVILWAALALVSGVDSEAAGIAAAAGEPLPQTVIQPAKQPRHEPGDQPALRPVYLPAVYRESNLPRPVAPLGQSIRDLAWADDVLYAAVGHVVMAYDASGPDVRVVAVSEPLPGVVMDVVAGDGVVYVAHADPSDMNDWAPGGLAVLSAGRWPSLRAMGQVRLEPATGYVSVAVDGDTLAALRCTGDFGWVATCDAVDVVDVGAPDRPRVLSSVSTGTEFPRGLGVAALGQGRFTDGQAVIDALDPTQADVVDYLDLPGKPVVHGQVMATWETPRGGGRVSIYQSLPDEAPRLLDSLELDALGLPAGARAAVAFDSGVLITGPDAAEFNPRGRWAFVPVTGGEVGAPITGDAEVMSVALAEGRGEVWHSLTRADLDSDLAHLPFTPIVGRQPIGPDARPAGAVQTAWTGWNWRTADVFAAGDLAFAVVVDEGKPSLPSNDPVEAPLRLDVYDTAVVESPRLIGALPDVCAPDGPVTNGVWEQLDDCSLTMDERGRLLISGARNASVVDVSDPAGPTIVARGPSLGSQLTNVPGIGVLTLHGAGGTGRPSVALYDTSSGDWPATVWEAGIRGEAYNLALSGDMISVAGFGGSGGPVLWTARLTRDAPTVWLVTEDLAPDGVPWAPQTLAGTADRIYIQRSNGVEKAHSTGWQDYVESIEEYGFSDGVPYLTRAAGLPGVRAAGATATIEDLVISQDWFGREFTFVSFGPSERPPHRLGTALYSDSTIEGDYWTDSGSIPQLMSAGQSYFYVTGHPNSEVWALP